MNESSNNAVILIIMVIALGLVFAVMHFADRSSSTTQLFSGTKGGSSKGINFNTSRADMYSDNLSGYKAKSNIKGAGDATSNINLPASAAAPSATIAQTDVQTVPQKQMASTNVSAASNYIQTNSKTFKTTSNDMLALHTNVPKSDINSTIKARTAEVAPVATIKGTPATKKGPQKGNVLDGGPGGQPGMGSLPVGDGTWILLVMMGMYATRKII